MLDQNPTGVALSLDPPVLNKEIAFVCISTQGGTLTKFNTGRLRPKVKPLTLLYTILAEKVPLLYNFFLKKGTPFGRIGHYREYPPPGRFQLELKFKSLGTLRQYMSITWQNIFCKFASGKFNDGGKNIDIRTTQLRNVRNANNFILYYKNILYQQRRCHVLTSYNLNGNSNSCKEKVTNGGYKNYP